MPYRVTRKGAADIIDIYVYGAGTFGAAQAECCHAGLEETLEHIADQPLQMRERPEFKPPVRLFAYRAHIVVYRVEQSGGVLIIRVLHGRQDWERQLPV